MIEDACIAIDLWFEEMEEKADNDNMAREIDAVRYALGCLSRKLHSAGDDDRLAALVAAIEKVRAEAPPDCSRMGAKR
jgi:hypothetical protein